jgi:hypothetical protein
MAFILGGDEYENGEHGTFPSPMEAYGVEKTAHIPICLKDIMVPIPCEYESHLAHLSESKSEMSDSTTICEIESIHFEGVSDTPHELGEVVDRSSEDILISNNLPSTSSVFSHFVIGFIHKEAPSLDLLVPQMEKMYMVDEEVAIPCIYQDDDGVGHLEAPTTTTPTSHERDYKGNDMGVDDAMIPLVDMMNCDCLHAMDDCSDISYASFTFPCDDLVPTNDDHVESFACDDIAIDMPCYRCFIFPPVIASNMLNNCSFRCLDCNDAMNACVVTNLMNNCSFPMFVRNYDIPLGMLCNECSTNSPIACNFICFACNDTHHMVDNEIAPIAFSTFGDFVN